MTTCPKCDGSGPSLCLVDGIVGGKRTRWHEMQACTFCGGANEVSEEKAEMYREGRRRREDRVSRGLSGREEAKRLGIDPLALNHMEQGRVAFPDQTGAKEG